MKSTPSIAISTSESRSSITIQNITYENVGFYSCKAKNEVGEAVTLGKVEIASMQSTHGSAPVKASETIKSTAATLETRVTKESVYETLETDEIKIQREVHFSKKEIFQEKVEITDMASLYDEPEINDLLQKIDANIYGPGVDTIRELTVIGYLIQKGSTIDDIKHIYNSNGFSALKEPESQFALVQLVEREGHGKLITEILISEHVTDDELLASTVGFLAFLKMIEMKHTTVETVISLLSREDFTRQEWKSIEGKEVQMI